jgi:hypothetical protein
MEILLSIMDLRSLSSSGVHRLLVFFGTVGYFPFAFAFSPSRTRRLCHIWMMRGASALPLDRSVCSINQFTKPPRGKSTFVPKVKKQARGCVMLASRA